MYIGILNQKLAAIEWQAIRARDGGTPRPTADGDPFAGERYAVPWLELAPSGLELHVRVTGNILLNCVVLRFAAKSEPTCVSLYTADKSQLLDTYHGETGRAIRQKEIALSVEGEKNSFVITIETELSDVILEAVELCGADLSNEEASVYPTPIEISVDSGESFPLSAYSTVSADSDEARRAIAVLREKLSEQAGVTLDEAEEGKIRLIHNKEIAANGYMLDVDSETIEIEADDLRGFVQGIETLIKLINEGEISPCHVEDAPFCEFRGVHLFLPAPDRMDYAKRLIKYILSPMGYNYIIMEIAGAMRFESHPEINEAFLEANRRSTAGEWPTFPHGSVGGRQIVEQDDIRDLCDYARAYGIEIIPEIQSLGHVQFMTQAYPEIAERPADAPTRETTDERLADIPPNEFYAHCYCPSNPQSYEILFDLIDEIVDVFRPARYVHMGHDEVYQIGVCPVCRERDPADLFAEDVLCIHDYLASMGLTMMMWSDMLQPVTKYKTPSAISMIPRDIVMLDFIWYFHTDLDIEDNLLSRGFEVIAGNMYSSHYPRYESRIRKKGMRGAQVSAWVPTDEESLAREGKLYDFLYSAQMLWSDSYTSHARYSYDRIISALLPTLREQMKGNAVPAASRRERELWNGGEWDPVQVECGLDTTVGGRYDALVFEHTALRVRHRLPWVELEVIGHYAVTYEDGEETLIPVTYAGNVSHYARRHHQPFTHSYYRHNGYTTAWETDGIEDRTEDGELYTIYRFTWTNPRPDIAIESLCYRPAEEGQEDLFVSRVVGLL